MVTPAYAPPTYWQLDERPALLFRVSGAIFDAGGAASLCQMLALGTTILADPPERRPRRRRLSTAFSEAMGLMEVFASVDLALMVIFHALVAKRCEPAIALEGVDPVAREVLDAGGHIAAMRLLKFAHTHGGIAPPGQMRDWLLNMGEQALAPVMQQLGSRPLVLAALLQADAGAH